MAKLSTTSVNGDLTVTGEVTSTIAGATTSTIGTVQLNDATNSTSTTTAATANAVKKAYDRYPGAASTSASGIVKLNNTTNSTSTTEAATAAAVKAAYDRAGHSHPYVPTSDVATTATANKVVRLDGSADVNCRLLRANYSNQDTISGAIAYRVNNSSDNYLRYCSSPSAVRTWLGAPSTAVATTSANGLMSSTDKGKLDGIAKGANNYVHPTGNGNTHIPTNGATNQVLMYNSAGTAKWMSMGTGSTQPAAGNHTHDSTYLKLAGGVMTGTIRFKDAKNASASISGIASSSDRNNIVISQNEVPTLLSSKDISFSKNDLDLNNGGVEGKSDSFIGIHSHSKEVVNKSIAANTWHRVLLVNEDSASVTSGLSSFDLNILFYQMNTSESVLVRGSVQISNNSTTSKTAIKLERTYKGIDFIKEARICCDNGTKKTYLEFLIPVAFNCTTNNLVVTTIVSNAVSFNSQYRPKIVPFAQAPTSGLSVIAKEILGDSSQVRISSDRVRITGFDTSINFTKEADSSYGRCIRPDIDHTGLINLGHPNAAWKDIYLRGSSFGSGGGWTKLPNGLILQWGYSNALKCATTHTIKLPTSFPNRMVSTVCSNGLSHRKAANGIWSAHYDWTNNTTLKSQFTLFHSGPEEAVSDVHWISMGY